MFVCIALDAYASAAALRPLFGAASLAQSRLGVTLCADATAADRGTDLTVAIVVISTGDTAPFIADSAVHTGTGRVVRTGLTDGAVLHLNANRRPLQAPTVGAGYASTTDATLEVAKRRIREELGALVIEGTFATRKPVRITNAADVFTAKLVLGEQPRHAP